MQKQSIQGNQNSLVPIKSLQGSISKDNTIEQQSTQAFQAQQTTMR